jgi:hypothetical protein
VEAPDELESLVASSVRENEEEEGGATEPEYYIFTLNSSAI